VHESGQSHHGDSIPTTGILEKLHGSFCIILGPGTLEWAKEREKPWAWESLVIFQRHLQVLLFIVLLYSELIRTGDSESKNLVLV
jgi:hypothetical protein